MDAGLSAPRRGRQRWIHTSERPRGCAAFCSRRAITRAARRRCSAVRRGRRDPRPRGRRRGGREGGDARQVVVAAMQAPRTSLGYIRVNGVRDVAGAWVTSRPSSGPGSTASCCRRRKVGRAVARSSASASAKCERRDSGMKAGTPRPDADHRDGEGRRGQRARSPPRARACAASRSAAATTPTIWTSPGRWRSTSSRMPARELTHAFAHRRASSRPIDTVVIQVTRHRALPALSAAEWPAHAGFAGKLCIHPDQVPPCNEAFTPTRRGGRATRGRVIRSVRGRGGPVGPRRFQLDGQFHRLSDRLQGAARCSPSWPASRQARRRRGRAP